MITGFIKMWITKDQSFFTLLLFIRKFLNKKNKTKQNRACCTTKFPATRLENALCRHATLEIVRNFETWVLGQLLYELELNFSEENKFKHRINYLTVYWCSNTFIKITDHWSLFLELREGNSIYKRSWDYVPFGTRFCLSIARPIWSS